MPVGRCGDSRCFCWTIRGVRGGVAAGAPDATCVVAQESTELAVGEHVVIALLGAQAGTLEAGMDTFGGLTPDLRVDLQQGIDLAAGQFEAAITEIAESGHGVFRESHAEFFVGEETANYELNGTLGHYDTPPGR
jgi:hypothetical protein